MSDLLERALIEFRIIQDLTGFGNLSGLTKYNVAVCSICSSVIMLKRGRMLFIATLELKNFANCIIERFCAILSAIIIKGKTICQKKMNPKTKIPSLN